MYSWMEMVETHKSWRMAGASFEDMKKESGREKVRFPWQFRL